MHTLTTPLMIVLLLGSLPLHGHDISGHRPHVGPQTLEEHKEVVPSSAQAFEPFGDHVGISWDDTYLYIEGNGLPQHNMMTGITAWQQQVPLPHDFTGVKGAFRIPLNPVLLDEPQELTLLGPIAVAVNGIPIFHSLTQSGKDAKAGGELDQWGGHCGRADDYHYHIAPGHLEAVVGKGNPVAYGLDGYPVYMANPAIDKPLDEAHGYFDDAGNYRYVSSDTAPYMMAKFRGAVDLDIRPRTSGVRPHLKPLRGARITDFEGSLEDGYTLHYTVNGQPATVAYQAKPNGAADFIFTETDGSVRTESYDARRQKGGKDKRPKGSRKKEQGAQPRGSKPKDEASLHQPWMQVHASELDQNNDQTVTLDELMQEISKVFASFDRNDDRRLCAAEMQTAPKEMRSALKGFVKEHNLEMDRDDDQFVSREEMAALFVRFFERQDANRDNQLSQSEYKPAN